MWGQAGQWEDVQPDVGISSHSLLPSQVSCVGVFFGWGGGDGGAGLGLLFVWGGGIFLLFLFVFVVCVARCERTHPGVCV